MNKPLKKNHIEDLQELEENSNEGLSERKGPSLVDNFDVKTEVHETNKKLKEPSKEELSKKSITKVKVFDTEESFREISPSKLKETIKNSEGIKKIVIEKIGVTDAKRVSLHFDEEGNEKVEKEKIVIRGAALKKLMEKANDRSELENSKKVKLEENSIQSAKSSSSLKKNSSVKLSLKSNSNKSSSHRQEIDDEGNVLRLRKKNDFTLDDSHLDMNIGEDHLERKVHLKEIIPEGEEKQLKKVKYTKHTLTKKKNRSHNGYYYRAKNHVELFKTGSSYLKDFNEGLKSFAFASFGFSDSRERTVFGISSFFNYHSNVSMVMVTSDFDRTFYRNFVNEFQVETKEVRGEELTFKVYKAQGFDVVDFEEIKKVCARIQNYNFEDFLENFQDDYDVVLWDLPEIDNLDKNKEVFFPIIQMLDNVTFIVKAAQTSFNDVKGLIEYFKRYKIDIKGVVLDKSNSSKKKGGAK